MKQPRPEDMVLMQAFRDLNPPNASASGFLPVAAFVEEHIAGLQRVPPNLHDRNSGQERCLIESTTYNSRQYLSETAHASIQFRESTESRMRQQEIDPDG